MSGNQQKVRYRAKCSSQFEKKTEILLEIRENLNQDEYTKNGNAAVITLKVFLLYNIVYMQMGDELKGLLRETVCSDQTENEKKRQNLSTRRPKCRFQRISWEHKQK